METRTVTHDTISAAIRTRYVRTALIEARYFQWLREAYPDIRKAEDVITKVPIPHMNGDDAALEEFGQKLGQLFIETQAEEGSELLKQAQRFVKWASRLHNLSGAPFKLGANAQFEREDLVKAFDSSFDEEDPYDEKNPAKFKKAERLGFWGKVAAAIADLDKPLTPKHQQPKEALTAAEQADPLSYASTENGSGT